MKLTTTKEKILNAVQLAERITGKKESLPVLSCVLLDGSSGKGALIVRATNLEAGIEVTVPCEVEDKGIIAVSASVLSQTLRSISGEKIAFRTEEGNLEVCIFSSNRAQLCVWPLTRSALRKKQSPE